MCTHFFILPHFPSPSPLPLLSLPAAACGRSTAVLWLAGSGCCHEQLVWEGKVSGCCNRPCYTYIVHAVDLLVHTYIRTYVFVYAELCFTCWTYTENATCITGMNLGEIIVRFHRIINIITLINKWLLTVHTVHSIVRCFMKCKFVSYEKGKVDPYNVAVSTSVINYLLM